MSQRNDNELFIYLLSRFLIKTILTQRLSDNSNVFPLLPFFNPDFLP